MSAITKGTDLIDLFNLAYRSNRPVLVEGTHGIGKSEIIKQASTTLGIECIVRDLSLMEFVDLVGLPSKSEGRTVYDPPAFLPHNGKGLLVFEELNRCEKTTRAPCLQLLTDRKLNDYVLPKGWLPVAAINPVDGYEVEDLDPALLSRFMHICFDPDVKGWLAWAEENDIHEDVLSYIKNTPDVFASSNPRAWKYVSDLLHNSTGSDSPRILNTAIEGTVGPVHAEAFFASRNGKEKEISADDVLRRYSKSKATVKKWVKAKRTDLLTGLVHNLRLALQNGDLCTEIAQKPNMKKNLDAVIKDLPAELRKVVRSAAREGGLL